MENLPQELIIKIFQYLEKHSFFALSRVNKRFLAISKNETLVEIKHQAQIAHLEKVFKEGYHLSDDKYHQGEISRKNKRLLKMKYLEFCAYLEDLTEQEVPGLKNFLMVNAKEIEYLAKDAKIKKDSNMSWGEMYKHVLDSKESKKCNIS